MRAYGCQAVALGAQSHLVRKKTTVKGETLIIVLISTLVLANTTLYTTTLSWPTLLNEAVKPFATGKSHTDIPYRRLIISL